MKLNALLKNITIKNLLGSENLTGLDDVEINNIQFDSRKVEKDDLFVATRGTTANGHDFIPMAIEKGAAAIVCEQPPKFPSREFNFPHGGGQGRTFIEVENSLEALGILACNFFDNPSQKLELVGVTGTNGKTTTATLLYDIFRKLGYKAGLVSTVCNYIDGTAVPTEMTTPDPMEINRLLTQMAAAGCKYAFMEVSSHAAEQRRIAGLHFAGGIFTNLTQDHLDYHKTMGAYRDAKKLFFDGLPKTAFALTNLDDKNGEFMLQNTKARKYTYSLRTLADFKTKILEHDFNGMLLEMNGTEVHVQFIGKFNAYNLTAVYGASMLLSPLNPPTGGDLSATQDTHKTSNFTQTKSPLERDLGGFEVQILTIISALHPVSGRFETLRAPQGYTAIIDYAHTPDALENVILTINDILQNTNGRLITVVGCGGNRDRTKRPIMARAAVNGSWKAILTSDNPRNEEPQDILNDMLEGLDEAQRRKSLTIVDRREAIRTACTLAQEGDVVLIAGKGHEDYQIVKGVKRHFDDREEVRKMF
ncbi:UDP-N-acetylmuramoyl-L-alanyl-D-glutamate--2,6-diaminopimelate ligase [Bacteroidia bacterium]|nr:UDP-N-acetylmuramoyl-L-alanyl-D-glutamate--2,6-diaminopimelate ligase [Bacteroidia bacterium]